MNNEHPISDEVLELAQVALSKGEHWMAYPQSVYFIDKTDVFFFKSQHEANEFASNNFIYRDRFHILHFNSIVDIYQAIPYEEKIIKEPDANGLFNHEGDTFTDALIDHIEQQQSYLKSQFKSNIMNEKNYEYLKDQLKYTGFGEGLQNELKEKMQQQSPEFQMKYSQLFGKDEVSATLHFKKSNESDMYFFNKYDAAAKLEKDAANVKQTFYVGKDNNITFKEAYNLMNGRSVNKDLANKEGEKYNAWVQLDFKESDSNGNFKMKQFHQNYGYDIEKALSKHPIKELGNDADKTTLLQSLQKGNRQAVTFVQDGKEQRHFIEANPQFKAVTVYDSNHHKVNNQTQKQREPQSQSSKQEAKKSVKPGDADAEPAIQKGQKSKRKKSVSVS